MTMTTTEMRVWVGCLACYNAGRLVGHWYDATEGGDKTSADVHSPSGTFAEEDREVLWSALRATVRTDDEMVFDDLGRPHEELWVMDHEGFGDLLTGECSPCEAQRIAEAVEDLSDGDELEAFSAWFGGGHSGYGTDELEDAVREFREHFHGVWDSEKDFAYSFAEEIGFEGHDGNYFDWDAYTRDLFLDGFTSHGISGYRIAVTSDY